MFLSLMYRCVNLLKTQLPHYNISWRNGIPSSALFSCFCQMFQAIKLALPHVKNSSFSPLTCSLYLAIQNFIPYGEEQVPTYLSKDY